MRFKPTLLAKALAILCLGIGSAGLYSAKSLQHKGDAAVASQSELMAQVLTEQRNMHGLEQLLSGAPPQTPPALKSTLASVMLALYGKQEAYGIVLNGVSAGARQLPGMANLDGFAQSIGDTGASHIPVSLSGRYATYEGLLGFIRALRAMPLGVSYLNVDGHNFKLKLDVIGVSSRE